MAPEEVAAYISRKKAHPYMAQLNDREILLTADTVVINRGEVLGKPADAEDAALMLRLLSGHTHKVVTGVNAGLIFPLPEFPYISILFHALRYMLFFPPTIRNIVNAVLVIKFLSLRILVTIVMN